MRGWLASHAANMTYTGEVPWEGVLICGVIAAALIWLVWGRG